MYTLTSGAAKYGVQPVSLFCTADISDSCTAVPKSASLTVRPPLNTSTFRPVCGCVHIKYIAACSFENQLAKIVEMCGDYSIIK